MTKVAEGLLEVERTAAPKRGGWQGSTDEVGPPCVAQDLAGRITACPECSAERRRSEILGLPVPAFGAGGAMLGQPQSEQPDSGGQDRHAQLPEQNPPFLATIDELADSIAGLASEDSRFRTENAESGPQVASCSTARRGCTDSWASTAAIRPPHGGPPGELIRRQVLDLLTLPPPKVPGHRAHALRCLACGG